MPLRREQSRVVICQGFRMMDHMSPTNEDRVTSSQILWGIAEPSLMTIDKAKKTKR